MGLFLTFDIGTSALKTALVKDNGNVAALSVREYSPVYGDSGAVEMAVDCYWRALVDGTRSVMAEAGGAPDTISAIGISSQGETFVPVDRSGHALHEALVWLDGRGKPIAEEWSRAWLTKEEFRASSGYPIITPELSLFKIAWLTQHKPETSKAWKFLCLPDYIGCRFTGETVTDPVIAQMTGLWDISNCEWSTRLADAAGISIGQLPDVRPAGSVMGHLTAATASELGLSAGIPVCVGTNDQLAGAIGAGNVRASIASETTGTALAVVATCSELWSTESLTVGHHPVGSRYFALAYAATSAIVLKWFRDLAASDTPYDELIAGAAAIDPGCDGLVVLPHFCGSGTPTFDANARGAIVGLTLGHTRAHLTRAIMESCACLLRECLAPIQANSDVEVVRCLGGAARSDLWLQMKADMLGIPMQRPRCSDAASLGAAMLAASGTGRFGSVTEAADAWYRPESTFEPNAANRDCYRAVYEQYRHVFDCLYGGLRDGG